MAMDYKEALEYLLRFADYERLPRSGIVWDLRRMERLLEGLGNPQHAARTVDLRHRRLRRAAVHPRGAEARSVA